MKVFIPFSLALGIDIEAALREIPDANEKAEFCVIGANMDENCVKEAFRGHPRVRRVYVVNADGIYAYMRIDRCAPLFVAWSDRMRLIANGDWIYARSALSATLGTLAPLIATVYEPTVVHLML